jgi:hypothetical protein
MDSVQLIAVFLFIIVVELAVLIYLYASINKVSSFDNLSYKRSIENVQNLWKSTGCYTDLTDSQIDIYRKLPELQYSKGIRDQSKRCIIAQQQKQKKYLDFLLPEHRTELQNIWVSAGCKKIPFPAQDLYGSFIKDYKKALNKNTIFESIKNWLYNEIEDMCE